MKKFFSILLLISFLLTLIPCRDIAAYTETNSEISKRIEAQKSDLKNQIQFTQSGTLYGYTGYKGVKLTENGQKCADIASLLGLMPDEVSDYFGENISRKDFATLLIRELGVLTGQSRGEMERAYGLKKLSDTKSTEARICASLNLLVDSGDTAFRPEETLRTADAAAALWRFTILTGGTSEPGEEKPIEKLCSIYDPYLKTSVWNLKEKDYFSAERLSREAALILTVRSFDEIVAAHLKEISPIITPTPTATPTPSPTVTPLPSITPELTGVPNEVITPDLKPETTEHSMVGRMNRRLTGDRKPTDCIWDVIKAGKLDKMDLGYGPVADPKKPEETTRVLRQLKAKETWFKVSYLSNGKLKETALYGGSRTQLEKYVRSLLAYNKIKTGKDQIGSVTSYFLSGNGLGTVVNACCEKPMITGEIGELEFSNKESAHQKVLYTNIELWIKNMDFKFKLDQALTLSNVEKEAKSKNSFLMIDPENQILLCYVKGDLGKNKGKLEGCWILKADVDSSGKKVYLDGHLFTFHSSGIRNVYEAHYLTEIE